MKGMNYLGLILLALSAGCHSPANDQSQRDSTYNKQERAVTEKTEKKVDSSKLVIGGKQAGKIHLGQYMEEVSHILGRPDDGDAAMGSALGIWYQGENKQLKLYPTVIFSSYRDSNMVIKAVKQVSVTAPGFQTAEGIHTGLKLSELLRAYPSLKKTETYVNVQRDSVFVYDSVADGIAFDLQRDTCTAITIHVKNRPANAVYLPVHPEWKKL
jgi:hypothetical protein